MLTTGRLLPADHDAGQTDAALRGRALLFRHLQQRDGRAKCRFLAEFSGPSLHTEPATRTAQSWPSCPAAKTAELSKNALLAWVNKASQQSHA